MSQAVPFASPRGRLSPAPARLVLPGAVMVRETERAVLLRVATTGGETAELWFPLTQVACVATRWTAAQWIIDAKNRLLRAGVRIVTESPEAAGVQAFVDGAVAAMAPQPPLARLFAALEPQQRLDLLEALRCAGCAARDDADMAAHHGDGAAEAKFMAKDARLTALDKALGG